jgi:hypothetical protein
MGYAGAPGGELEHESVDEGLVKEVLRQALGISQRQ